MSESLNPQAEAAISSRRNFLKQALLLAAGGAVDANAMPEAIQQALKINPAPGTTWKDAEHVVILMQENRSFDHTYGTLRGVRGFEDPRAISLPNGNPVWLQTDRDGDTFAPFRLNIRESKATWMGCLPHNFPDQAAARNNGHYDGWLDAKRHGANAYAKMPMTLGYYTREDIPFYHSLADAFTVCDQNFCSSLTGTTPNRLHLWSGKIRADDSAEKRPAVYNSDADHRTEVSWRTLPELLQDNGVTWKVYQNEIDISTGMGTEEHQWLANFGDNPLEYFTQYNIRFSRKRRVYLLKLESTLSAELAKLSDSPGDLPTADAAKAAKLSQRLDATRKELEQYSPENFAKLPKRLQELHRRAFTTNEADPHYRELEPMAYHDGTQERSMDVPKGDVLFQLRQDADTGKLPAVSWIVAPRNFCDHPDAPWYGAWYLAETLEILTRNPEVWKKTIFILCYDENDGYFDHVPPFIPPVPHQPSTGLASAGIDTTLEHVNAGPHLDQPRSSPIGLGYRVPLVVASPWSRGGFVCSEVFDHTSIARFVETFASLKSGKAVKETNISQWRRTVCGDLTSVFRPWNGEDMELPVKVDRAAFLGSVHQAQFRQLPTGFKKFTEEEMTNARENLSAVSLMPRQEKGTRPSCPLPYELTANGALSPDRQAFVLKLGAGSKVFGASAAGAPFQVYLPVPMLVAGSCPDEFELKAPRNYAVAAGDELQQSWRLGEFPGRNYSLRVHGPNGFYREFQGGPDDPSIEVYLTQFMDNGLPTGDALLSLSNCEIERLVVVNVADVSYGASPRQIIVAPSSRTEIVISLGSTQGWHDLLVTIENQKSFRQRFAGRLEIGRPGISDPLIGRQV